MKYFDFEVRVRRGADSEWPVSVVRAPSGEAEGTLRLLDGANELRARLERVGEVISRSIETAPDLVVSSPPSSEPISALGRDLFDALFAGQIYTAFRRSQDRARNEEHGLRLRLRFDDAELAVLPWELMFDPADGDYLCLSASTPIVRYMDMDRPPDVLRVEPPLSVAVFVSSPSDRSSLDTRRECDRIEQATTELSAAGLLRLEWLEGSTWRDLQRAMRRQAYHVFHFVGHGSFDAATGQGVLDLTDEEGRSDPLNATEISRLLSDHATLRVVLLNSCLGAAGSTSEVFSSTASVMVRRGVPAVVAMQFAISDRAAIEFSQSFYEAIVDGAAVDTAVTEARKSVSVSMPDSIEWATPVLHMRSADGVLFDIERPDPAPLASASMSPRQKPTSRASRAAVLLVILAAAALAVWWILRPVEGAYRQLTVTPLPVEIGAGIPEQTVDVLNLTIESALVADSAWIPTGLTNRPSLGMATAISRGSASDSFDIAMLVFNITSGAINAFGTATIDSSLNARNVVIERLLRTLSDSLRGQEQTRALTNPLVEPADLAAMGNGLLNLRNGRIMVAAETFARVDSTDYEPLKNAADVTRSFLSSPMPVVGVEAFRPLIMDTARIPPAALASAVQSVLLNDLANQAGFTVVDISEEAVAAYESEQFLARSGRIDPSTAPRLGRRLVPGFVVRGTLIMTGDSMEVRAQLARTGDADALVRATASTALTDLFTGLATIGGQIGDGLRTIAPVRPEQADSLAQSLADLGMPDLAARYREIALRSR